MEFPHFNPRMMTKRVKSKNQEKHKARYKAEEPVFYVQVYEGGRKYETGISLKMKLRKPWNKPNPEEICSVIPGSVLSLFVHEGDHVEKDQELIAYEAMKMHSMIRAPFAGTVERIAVKSGDKLQKGALLMVIKANEPVAPSESPAPEFYLEDFG